MAKVRSRRRETEALVAERDFLLNSLEDLELEHRAGDIDDADYAQLRASYVARAAITLRALEASSSEEGERGESRRGFSRFRRYLGRARTRRVLIGLTVLCLIGVLAGVALSLAGVRLPGQSATGSVSLPANESVAEQLSEASVFGSAGQLTEAISLYSAVLGRDPHNAQALTYRAWLVRLVGIEAGAADEVRAGDTGLAEAVRLAPGYAPARAFDGLARLQDEHDAKGAVSEFDAFLADRPPAALLGSIGPEIAEAFLQAKVKVPKAFVVYLGGAAAGSSGPG